MLTIIGFATLREEEKDQDVRCQCCGRGIVHLAYMSNGQVWGRTCALKTVKMSKKLQGNVPVVLTLARCFQRRIWNNAIKVLFRGELCDPIVERVGSMSRWAVRLPSGATVAVSALFDPMNWKSNYVMLEGL